MVLMFVVATPGYSMITGFMIIGLMLLTHAYRLFPKLYTRFE